MKGANNWLDEFMDLVELHVRRLDEPSNKDPIFVTIDHIRMVYALEAGRAASQTVIEFEDKRVLHVAESLSEVVGILSGTISS